MKPMSNIQSKLITQAQAELSTLQELRRELHQIPEFGITLPKTLQRVIDEVKDLGELKVDHEISCATLLINGEKPGPVVLLRADMDALAVHEETGLPFASTNGYMHACGHDLHIAMGVGAARLIHANKAELAGSVLIWFQSGEEGHGGADMMIDRNMHLAHNELPIAAYGLHVFSGMTKGVFFSKPGPLMASAGDALVTFKGKGGHGSMPWSSRDPISVMAESITAIQTMVAKRFSPFDPVIVNVGWVKAGDDHTTNVTPEIAKFGATVRTFSDKNFDDVRVQIRRTVEGIAAAFDIEVEVEFTPSSLVVVNTPAETALAQELAVEGFGKDRWMTLDAPITGGEDFASVLKVIPGAFIFLGACAPGIDFMDAEINHSNKAIFDDSVLGDGAAMLASLAFEALTRASA